ncbi:unnamed protein product [Effrenium voratum]|nr:unnamed protein product [Effrenium voratum]
MQPMLAGPGSPGFDSEAEENEILTSSQATSWRGLPAAGLVCLGMGMVLAAVLAMPQAHTRRAGLRSAVSLVDMDAWSGVALKSGNANYDTVFNQTLFDCVSKSHESKHKKTAIRREGECFDHFYARDFKCRKLGEDPVTGSCMGIQQCLLGNPYGPIQNPCQESCGDADEKLFASCQVQFSALQLLARTCVPKWVIHDQQTDWRLYQTRDTILGITKRCGKPIKDDPFFNS